MKKKFIACMLCICMCCLCGCTGQEIKVIQETNNGTAGILEDPKPTQQDADSADTENSEQDETEDKENKEDDAEDDAAEEKQPVSIFELPVYNSTMKPEFEANISDVDGWRHTDCYSFFCVSTSLPKEDEAYIRWELNGEYQTISGKLYETEVVEGYSYWLVFCDKDDTPIYTTERLTYDKTSIEFEFDVSDIDYLTMYAYFEGSSLFPDDIIADNIYIS